MAVRVTALGSLPGTDVGGGVRLGLGSTPDLPWLAEFPARGPWASIPGRGTALLEGLGAGYAAGEWRLSATPGIDQRRARATLRDDLDVLVENADGYAGPLKLAVPGPWTMSAAVLRPLGGRVLGDRGARADVAASLAEGVRLLVGEVRRHLPGVEVVLQVDEPSLPAVLAGAVPTEGGYFRHRSVTEEEAAGRLAEFASLVDRTLVHCCAPSVPVALLLGRGRHGAGFGGVSLDATLVRRHETDALAVAVEAGHEVFLGVLGATEEPSVDVAARRPIELLRPLELGHALVERLWLTPTCGLAAAPPARVPRLLDALVRAAGHVGEALAR